MILNFSAEEREILNKKLENYLRPVRFRESEVIPDTTDGRTPFDSDFARVALSAPIRRLQDKTQVFPLPEYDFVRSRLTHSLEVLCIARGLGLGVEKVLSANGLFEIGKIDHYHHAITSILETAAMIHDIGNPPFGHKIEKTVQDFFKNIKNPFIEECFNQLNDLQKTDLQNIEGNSQGFRILRHLALAKDEYSYNLTMPTMSTIIRGNKKGVGIPHEQEKFGYLQAESEAYSQICSTLGLRPEGHRHPLTYLLEAADDIAYSVCDIEDAYKNGMVRAVELMKNYHECGYHDAEIDKCIETLASDDEVVEQYNIQSLRIKIQSKMIIECTKTFCRNYKKIIEGDYRRELLEDSDVALLKVFCKNTIKSVFKEEEIVEKEKEASEAVQFLLEGFLLEVLLLTPETPKDSWEYTLYKYISPNYRKIACEDGMDVPTDTYKKFLLVTDHIFGMTDGFLMKQYEDENVQSLIKALHEKLGIKEN